MNTVTMKDMTQNCTLQFTVQIKSPQLPPENQVI
jgi:hypothetical protein